MPHLNVRPMIGQRLYSRHGARILVYDDAVDSKPLLWAIDCATEAIAEVLMDDLWYGEYTGA